MGVNQAIDITAKQHKTILALLKWHLPDTVAWVYGSRAKWTSQPKSDLDMVVFARSEQRRQVINLGEAFEESDLPFRVDLFVWDEVPELFRREIEAEHIVLVEARTEEVRQGWYKTSVGKFCPFLYGKSLPEKKRENGDYSVYGSNGAVGMHNQSLADEGVIIGRKGTVGAVNFSAHPFWPIDTTFYVKDASHRNTRFTYYLLKSLGMQSMNSDSAVPGLNRDAAHAQIVEVPPLPEQHAIANILGTLDDKIELNHRMNKTLEEMTQALFKSWFVDFEPVKAKLAVLEKGGTADEAERAAMCAISGKNEITLAKLQLEQPEAFANLAHTAAQFPPAMQDSELGEIPEGWGIKPLDEVANFQNGLALQKFRPQNQEGRLPIVKIAQLRSGKADSEEWSTANIRPECIIGDGDVIFSWSGSLMVKMWVGGRAALNQHLFKVTSTNYPKWFFFYCVLSHLGDFQSIAAGKATTMGHIKRQHLSDALCVVPEINHLVSVERFFAPILATYVSAEISNRTLRTLRDSLLPKLISGVLQKNSRVSTKQPKNSK